jgi:hypothetical protein
MVSGRGLSGRDPTDRRGLSLKVTKTMIPNAKRDSIFAFAIAVVEAAAMCGRRSAHLLFDALQGAYDTHRERVQMRLAPVKSRSWRDIPRARAQVLSPPAVSMNRPARGTTNR